MRTFSLVDQSPLVAPAHDEGLCQLLHGASPLLLGTHTLWAVSKTTPGCDSQALIDPQSILSSETGLSVKCSICQASPQWPASSRSDTGATPSGSLVVA